MVVTEPETTGKAWTRPALIDCDLHNELHGDIDAVLPYVAARWRGHLAMFGARHPAGAFYPRFLDHREDFRPPSGRRSGSDVHFLKSRYLDPYNVAYAILIPLSGVAGIQSHELAGELARGVNDWQVAEWLDHDDRLRASITIAHEAPDLAVEEIRHRAADKRFVQVQFSGRPQEPMGRRKYWPIYEACAEYGLPVMSHAFGSYGQPITGTGWPSFYLEEHVGPAQAMQHNLTSLVIEGVFERFPDLKVVSVENGFAWLPSLMWRLDTAWAVLRQEVPHLKRLPSEYIREHVYLTTQPIEEPHRPRYFRQMWDHFGDLIDHVMFASDYPHWDADDPDEVFPVDLPPEMLQKIYHDNAQALYRLPE